MDSLWRAKQLKRNPTPAPLPPASEGSLGSLLSRIRKIRLLLIVISLFFTYQARADDKQIISEATTAAAIEGGKIYFKNWADSLGNVPGTSIGIGASGLAIVDLLLAIDNYNNARNDKQRFHVGLNASVAVYVLASGPGAPVVAAAVAAAMLVEAGLDARHAVTMLDIYQRIEQHQQRIIEINTMLAKADGIALEALLSQLKIFSATMALAVDSAKSCDKAEKITTLDQLDQCIFWVNSYYSSAQVFVYTSDRLLEWISNKKEYQKLFEQINISPDSIRKSRDYFFNKLQFQEDRIRLTNAYSDYLFKLIQQKPLDTPTFSNRLFLSKVCIDKAGEIVRSANFIDLNQLQLTTEIQKDIIKTRIKILLEVIEKYTDSTICSKLVENSDLPESKVLSEWLTLVAESKASLEKGLKR
ncbi:MAG: hypothetical protein P9F75_04325 [Candidatus Contendobacter sp.]|nr:hypothetical protein [Candidatus Contendobacter sp.]